MSREEAARRAKAENRGVEIFMDLVRQHDRGLRMLAYRLLQDQTTMDDAMQDAYLKAFRGFSGFRRDAQARTWLYRIVYNTCLDRLRSERRRREVSLDLAAEIGGDARSGSSLPAAGYGLDPAEAVVRRSDLAAALASLPADQRAAVLMVDVAGFTYEEAAGVLDLRPGTVASRLHHARSLLRTSLVLEEG